MASTYISKTFSSSGTSDKIWTMSVWVKRANPSTEDVIFAAGTSEREFIRFETSGELTYRRSAGTTFHLKTNRKFRDTNAWYHIVIAVDTSQSTDSNKYKLYINGVQETSFATATYMNNNYLTKIGGGQLHTIGKDSEQSAYFDGCMSHFHFCDGTQLAPTVFGETDSTTGEWKIKTDTSFTLGTNGFTVLKDGNTYTDQSSNSNDFALGGGTLTKTEDNPSNVFCTLNPLNSVYISFLQGNNTISGGNNGTDYSYIGSTLAANSGKFYWEVKAADLAEIDQVGVARASSSFSHIGTGHGLQGTPYGGKGVQFSNGNKAGDDSQSAYMGGFSTDDIMMIALDLDNNKITFGRNGQWANGSGGADQTYANSTAAFTNLTSGEYYMPAHAMRGYGGNTGISRYNFGNGYFATVAVSSAGTNASGNGIFEYDVPSGFTALSTKGLNL